MQLTHSITKTLGAAALTLAATTTLAAPASVDLRSRQTPIRDQGARNTCITFAAIAGLEAAYLRAGYGRLDLSEQFLNHTGKTFWLHPVWDDVVARGRDGAEAQVGAFGGGGGAWYAEALASGFRVPAETAHPYVGRQLTAADHPHLAYAWDDPFWGKQKRQNDFNLDQRFLPRSALESGLYYRANVVSRVAAKDVTALEDALAAGKEVIWDFDVARTTLPTWQPCPTADDECLIGSHSMLLVGYDRRSADPAQHVFIAKNSWGTSAARPDGFTYLSYAYVRRYGIAAATIDSVLPPAAWPEIHAIGRWNLSYDGWRGTLDAYHLPGIAQSQLASAGVTTRDKRLGAFYDADGNSFRVNGGVVGDRMDFYMNTSRPNLRWDEVSGRWFAYFKVANRTLGPTYAGAHQDADGTWYGGYARVNGFVASARTPRPVARDGYLNANWDLYFLNKKSTVRFTTADDSWLTPAERARYQGIVGTYTPATGAASVARALVSRANPNNVVLRLPTALPPTGTSGNMVGYHMNHENGIVAGSGRDGAGADFGFLLVRRD